MFAHLGDDLAAYGGWFLFVVVVPALILYNLIVAPLSRAIRRRKDRRRRKVRILYNLIVAPLSRAIRRWKDRRRRKVRTDFPTDPQLPDPRQWALESFGISLDSDQATAVGLEENCDALIAARAGSGKTRVLTTRALWLQDVCGVAPSELLLVAFNRDAAGEVKDRLESLVGGNVPHVMTFHALGNAVYRPERLIADSRAENQYLQTAEVAALSSRVDRSQIMSSVVRDLASSGRLLSTARKLRLAPFSGDWYAIENGLLDVGGEDEKADLHGDRRPRIVLEGEDVTIDGERVKSHGERVISNILFLNAVEYEYERKFDWDGSPYNPDFAISTGEDSGVAIEYFGRMSDPEYRRQAEEKRRYWSDKPEWTLIERTPGDLMSRGETAFTTHLLEELDGLGVAHRQLSPDEIEAALPEVVDRHEHLQAYTGFVVRSRTLGLNHQELRERISNHQPADLEEAVFLEAVAQIYEMYLDEVIVDGCDDFDGVVWGAAERIRGGDVGVVRQGGRNVDLRKIRYVLIDEYQDFSEPFHALIGALRAANPEMKVFAVGDDWQAINSFAGSDLKFFQGFSDFFPGSVRVELPRNYRSAKPIVEVSNALMAGGLAKRLAGRSRGQHGAVAASDRQGERCWLRLWDLESLQLSEGEKANHDGAKHTAGLLRILKDRLRDDGDVVLLSRNNTVLFGRELDDYLDELLAFLPEHDRDRVSISTVHRYKGQEATAVIVIDAEVNRWPFIHPDWKFQRALGDTIQLITAAEKRLFYVALTRAKSSLDIIGPFKEDRSPLVREIEISMPLGDWLGLPPGDYVGPEKWDVRVFNAYDVKETLKERRFTFDKDDRYWHRMSLPAELPDLSKLERQKWFVPPVVVKVVSLPTGDVVFESHADGSYRFERPPELPF
jgi:DNA helicase-4